MTITELKKNRDLLAISLYNTLFSLSGSEPLIAEDQQLYKKLRNHSSVEKRLS